MTVSSGSTTDTLNYSYDALQRLTSQTTVRTGLTLAKEYSYKNLSGNRTTTQVSGYTAKVNGSAVDSYTYSYDNLGNITIVNRSGNLPLSYTYDAQNQLIRVVEGVYRYEYTYDTYGNILTVKHYDDDIEELISSNTYSYTDSQWVDQLTAFNGQSITYDEIGNPLSYYNGSRYTFTWNGRELATAVKGSTSVSYKYGTDGLRTQKTVGSTVYNYYYVDGLLVRQTWGTNYMDFLYDESGSPYSFIYNGTQYYYIKNLQGDVMRIVDTSGAVVANYTYDAWGKVTNSGNIVGLYNPIRYRGYYYDTDTGFYYLQSRYYDPMVKRFINANGDFFKLNLYVYCENNPVMYKKSIISSDNSITEPSISSLVSIGIYDSLCISLNASSSKNTIGFGKVNWGNDDFQIPIWIVSLMSSSDFGASVAPALRTAYQYICYPGIIDLNKLYGLDFVPGKLNNVCTTIGYGLLGVNIVLSYWSNFTNNNLTKNQKWISFIVDTAYTVGMVGVGHIVNAVLSSTMPVVGPLIAPFVSVAVVGVIDLTNEKWRWLDALKQWLNE